MRLTHCHNFHDFRELARRRLPGPIFNYIDGAADDEVTCRRRDGSTFPALEHLCAVPDAQGRISHHVLSFSDISAIRDVQHKLQHLPQQQPQRSHQLGHKEERRMA